MNLKHRHVVSEAQQGFIGDWHVSLEIYLPFLQVA